MRNEKGKRRTWLRIAFPLFSLLLYAASPTWGQSADFAAIDSFVGQRMRAMKIPGASLCIVQDDRMVHLAAFGVVDANKRAATPQTPFALASLTKSFTGVAVMQLVEAGKIRLDDPVQKYVPYFRVADAEASRKITVRHLLNQTSGLPASVGREGIADLRQDDAVIEENVRRTARVRLSHPPGTEFEYCNANYNIAGAVIAAASGMPYRECIETHIFAPLEMRRSYATDAAARAGSPPRSLGHRFWFGIPVATTFDINRGMLPAGGLICSAEDLGDYLIAQLNNGTYKGRALLSPESLAITHAPAVRTTGDAAYGMGWNIGKAADGETLWRHSGDGSDFHANIVCLPDKRLGFVLLVNVNSAAWIAGGENNAIANGITNLLLGRTPEPPAFNGFSLLVIASVAVPSLIVVARLFFLIRAGRRRAVPVTPRRLSHLTGGFLGDALLLLFYVFGLPLVYQLPLPEVALFLPDAFSLHCLGAILTIAGTLYRLWLLRRKPSGVTAG